MVVPVHKMDKIGCASEPSSVRRYCSRSLAVMCSIPAAQYPAASHDYYWQLGLLISIYMIHRLLWCYRPSFVTGDVSVVLNCSAKAFHFGAQDPKHPRQTASPSGPSSTQH